MGQVLELDSQIILPAGSSADAINRALVNFDQVFLEPGTYSLGTNELTIPVNKLLAGIQAGANDQPVLVSTLTSGTFINADDSSELRNLLVDGPGSGSANGIENIGASRIHLDRVTVQRFGVGIDNMSGSMFHCTIQDQAGDGVVYGGRFDIPMVIRGCRFLNNGSEGVLFSFTTVDGLHIIDSIFDGNGGTGISFSGVTTAANIFISNCLIDNNSIGIAVGATTIDRLIIDGCTISSNSQNGINITSSSVVGGCAFTNLNILTTSSGPGEGIRVGSGSTIIRDTIFDGIVARGNTGTGIRIDPASVNQVRITNCAAKGNGVSGIEASGALEGGADTAGHVWGNRAEGNTVSDFNISAAYVTADNV